MSVLDSLVDAIAKTENYEPKSLRDDASRWPESESDYDLSAFEAHADAVVEHLWQRADDPEVVEAVAKATWDSSPENARWGDVRKHRAWDIATDPMLSDAKAAITALLTALLGPRPTEQENANER